MEKLRKIFCTVTGTSDAGEVSGPHLVYSELEKVRMTRNLQRTKFYRVTYGTWIKKRGKGE